MTERKCQWRGCDEPEGYNPGWCDTHYPFKGSESMSTITETFCDRCHEPMPPAGNHYRLQLTVTGVSLAAPSEKVVLKDCCRQCVRTLVDSMRSLGKVVT